MVDNILVRFDLTKSSSLASSAMAKIDYYAEADVIAKTTGSMTPLKFFGISIYNRQNNDAACDNSSSSQRSETLNPIVDHGGRKYECQYCNKGFSNSHALGGHQNAHKRERRLLKWAQMQATLDFATSHLQNPLVSAFTSPHHLIGGVGVDGPDAEPSSWLYMTRGGTVGSFGGGNNYSAGSTAVPERRVYASEFEEPILFRHENSMTQLNGLAEHGGGHHGERALSLDLHLSLGPSRT